MSLLIIAERLDGAEATNPPPSHPVGRALRAAQLQGFVSPRMTCWGDGAAWWYPTPGQPPSGSGCWIERDGRFAASVGSFHWRGQPPSQALEQMLDHRKPIAHLPLSELSGSTLLLLGREDGVWLVGDSLGMLKAYEAVEAGVLSTSLLVCRAALGRVAFDRQGVQEYVLLGTNHSRRTPIRGLNALDPTQIIELRSGRRHVVHGIPAFQPQPSGLDLASAADRVASVVRSEFGQLLRAHGTRVGMALSGGFDSRLLLAALDHLGVAPALYVYGRASDGDVSVAQQVASRLCQPIAVIDKSALESGAPPLSRERLLQNQRFFDGLPIDGVFDRGSDHASRLWQVHDGQLNLNGGGGEILRNFFYLANRPFSAADVQAAFYSGFFDEVFLSREERQAFIHMVQDDILASLGRLNGSDAARRLPLPRQEVELIYTTFRLRWWMGRNNSAAARYGAFMTPLVTPSLVSLAAGIPLGLKEFGRLEAQVISSLSPRVAAGPSAYGFEFLRGPNVRQRLNVRLTLHRPLALRKHSIRVQRALGQSPAPTVPQEWCDALGEPPCHEWLNPDELNRVDQVNRLMTVQALRKLDP